MHLAKRLPRCSNKKTDKRVYFRGDQRANYGAVMSAIDGVRAAGVSQLGHAHR